MSDYTGPDVDQDSGLADVSTVKARAQWIAGVLEHANHTHNTAYESLSCATRRIFAMAIANAVAEMAVDTTNPTWVAAYEGAMDMIELSVIDATAIMLAGECAMYAMDARAGLPLPEAVFKALEKRGEAS